MVTTSTIPTAPTALTIDDGDCSHSQQHQDPNLPPLDERVLAIVRTVPNLTVRPAKLTSELGLSIEDASAELCGLMSAVGSTATFRFETVRSATDDGRCAGASALTMVFTFPQDFERRARNSRRTNDAKAALLHLMTISLKLARVIVAFGLVVSLAVVILFGLCAAVALVVALSRNGGDNFGRRRTGVMVRMLLKTLRELLWVFAVFGPCVEGEAGDGGLGDPYWTDSARNALGLCYGPTSPWFWMRMARWNRRTGTSVRERGRRSWGGRSANSRYRWSDEDNSTTTNQQQSQSQQQQQQQQRGILSVAVEFLFGPTPFFPGPSERAKWKIRQRVLVALSSSSDMDKNNNNRPGVSIAQILPFVDQPPPLPIQSSSTAIVSEALKVVSHFNGVPVKDSGASDGDNASGDDEQKPFLDMTQSRFVFPELMSEEETVGKSSNELVVPMDNNMGLNIYDDGNENHQMWESFFYTDPNNAQGIAMARLNLTMGRTNNEPAGALSPPMYLKESRHVLTQLTPTQFGQCILLNTINTIGIWMFRKSIESGGLLEISYPLGYTVTSGLLCFLAFYAKLFFALPTARMVYIICLNLGIQKRNERRKALAE